MEIDKGKVISNKTLCTHQRQSIWKVFDSPGGKVRKGQNLKESILVFVIQGRLLISIGGLGKQIIYAGEMFLIPSGSIFSVCLQEERNRIMVCTFQVNTLLYQYLNTEKLLTWLDKIPSEIISLRIYGRLTNYLSLLSEYITDGIDSPEFYELKKRELFFLLFEGYNPQELAEFLYPVIGEDIAFKEFVLNNFMKVRNVGQLASMANYSTSGFIKKFQRSFNQSPYKWMLAQKAKKLLEEIIQGESPLQELAFKYNFSSYQHFSTFCKTHYGAPPSEVSIEKNRTHKAY